MRIVAAIALLAVFSEATPPKSKDIVGIRNGFGTGNDFQQWSDIQRRWYAMGAANGMLLAPVFDAPKKETAWFEKWIENMNDGQLTAVISRFLRDNPERWNENLTTLTYAAFRESYNRSLLKTEK